MIDYNKVPKDTWVYTMPEDPKYFPNGRLSIYKRVPIKPVEVNGRIIDHIYRWEDTHGRWGFSVASWFPKIED